MPPPSVSPATYQPYCLPSHQIVAVSSTQIAVYTIPALSTEPTSNGAPGRLIRPKSNKDKAKVVSLPTLDLIKILEKPSLPNLAQGSTVSFRAARYSLLHLAAHYTKPHISCRYHPDDWTQLYAVMNSKPPLPRGKRGAYVVRWNTKNWEVTKSKKIADAGITCMDIRYAHILACHSALSIRPALSARTGNI